MPVPFSVVVPLYNKGPHVERSLRSALAQSLAPAEIIVVDDSSTDDGPARVAGLGDPLIRMLRRAEPGPGGYAARNLAIDEARTDWVAFLDADDEWAPHHLATLSAAIEAESARPGVVAAFSGYRIVDPGDREILDRFSRTRGEIGGRFDYAALVRLWVDMRACPIWTSATAARRDALVAAGKFPAGRCRRGGDKDLWLRLAAEGDVVRTGDIGATYWRDSVNMVTSAVTTHQRHCMCDTIRALIRTGDAETGRLLRRLYNVESFIYGKFASRARPVDPESYEGYYASDDPLGYLTLRLLSTPIGWRLAQAAYRLKSQGRGDKRDG